MNLLKDFKNNEVLMLVVAFLLGYFANRMLKGCRLVEGNSDTCSGNVTDMMNAMIGTGNCGGTSAQCWHVDGFDEDCLKEKCDDCMGKAEMAENNGT